MGLIKAAGSAIGSTFADSWKEAIHCEQMDNTVILRNGAQMSAGKGSNTKGSANVISNGSAIMVGENLCMLTIDNGKITNIVTEPGRYILDNSSAPSIFAGQIKDSVKDLLQRFTFGGVPSVEQKVIYINLQQLPGIKFGTGTPMPYPDPRYNTTIDLRFHGTFEIQVPDAEMAVKFYQQVAVKGSGAGDMTVAQIFSSEQYKNEFMQSMKIALNMLSTQGISYGQISMHLNDLTNNVQQATRENWQARGFMVTRIGMGPVTLSEESKELLKDRLKADTMLGGDVQKAMMVGSVARGIEAAGSNEAGAMMGFMGMNMAMNAGGNILGGMGETPPQQPSQWNQNAAPPSNVSPIAGGAQTPPSAADGWKCQCGATNNGAFCSDCGSKKPEVPENWACPCGTQNTGRFCSNCGSQKPDSPWKCSCGFENTGRFCSNCGNQKQ
ncbi:MAG: SPFH domain-containing protein [Oscillospiraceae bacterium]|nr:SPFH domain-containing protein [Oscillospiraceae bacterium]